MEQVNNSGQQQMLELARQETWITTPFSYIKLGSKLTLLQQDTMLMVSEHLQQYIKNFFDLNLHKTGAKPRPLFTKYLLENGIPPFRIYLADMGINAANYRVTREAIEEMNLLVEHQEVDKDGKPTGTTIFSPVFKKFKVPLMDGRYQKKDEEGKIVVDSAMHSGYIEVEINNDVAQWAFDMAQGYLNHPMLIARYASKRSTPRLYFKLLREMGNKKSAVIRLTVQEVKDFLGFETYKDESTGKWVEPYAKFAHFKTKVLDAVQKDLEEMAKQNHIDITFTYRPVYRNGRMRGNPDFIEFTVVSTELGRAYSLLSGITSPAVDEANARARKQLDLFAEEEQRQQNYKRKWEDCLCDILTHVSREENRRVFADLRFEFFDTAKNQLILAATQEDYAWLEQEDVLNILMRPNIIRHFGQGVSLGYRILQKSPNP